MDSVHFIKEVQNRASLNSKDEAMECIRATLETLSERLRGGEPQHVASQLPPQIGECMKTDSAGKGESMSLQEFCARVSKREGKDGQDVSQDIKAVFSVLRDAIDEGELNDLCSQLPEEYVQLFGMHKPSPSATLH